MGYARRLMMPSQSRWSWSLVVQSSGRYSTSQQKRSQVHSDSSCLYSTKNRSTERQNKLVASLWLSVTVFTINVRHIQIHMPLYSYRGSSSTSNLMPTHLYCTVLQDWHWTPFTLSNPFPCPRPTSSMLALVFHIHADLTASGTPACLPASSTRPTCEPLCWNRPGWLSLCSPWSQINHCWNKID